MMVAFRAGAGLTFRPEKSHDRNKTVLPAGWSPDGARANRLNLCFRSAEKLLQILFKKIDYLPHRTEIRRG